jgi:hypothetical protein
MNSEMSMPEDSRTQELNQTAANWMNFLLCGIGMTAACEGLSVKSALSKFTTLSPAHLSTRGLQIKSPKRQREVTAAGEKVMRERLIWAGYTAPEIDALCARRPVSPLAALTSSMGIGIPNELALTTAFASRLDALGQEALAYLETHDLPAYRKCLTRFIREEMNSHPNSTELKHLLIDMQRELDSDGIATVRRSTDRVLDYALHALLSALDLEWSTQYFHTMQPTPTLHWLFPRFHPDFSPTGSIKIKRDLVSHPNSHLLTLCWLVVRRALAKTNRWQAKAPGPAELTRAIGVEEITEGQVRKLTTGQQKLTLSKAIAIWDGLCQALPADRPIPAPMPWMFFGIWMQTQHVHTRRENGKKHWTVVILDEPKYKALWRAHREHWSSQLPQPGTMPWPEWLLAQSSWSDWMRPVQSSGLSSSPRDCQ